MIETLIQLLRGGIATQRALFPDLPEYNRGLPKLTSSPCAAESGCRACVDVCPTNAIEAKATGAQVRVTLDLGKCIACGGCASVCPSGTIAEDKSTKVARIRREDLILSNDQVQIEPRIDAPASITAPFRRSIHIREVSTGDSASDVEVAAANNPIFDASRFGIHFVASPRFADALLVTGPVARAMQEPLRRCYEAMAEPRS